MMLTALLKVEVGSLLLSLMLLMASDTVAVTLITSVTTVVIALIALVTLILTMKNQQAIATATLKIENVEKKTDVVHGLVNGVSHELNAAKESLALATGRAEATEALSVATSAQAHAIGVLEGQVQERAREQSPSQGA